MSNASACKSSTLIPAPGYISPACFQPQSHKVEERLSISARNAISTSRYHSSPDPVRKLDPRSRTVFASLTAHHRVRSHRAAQADILVVHTGHHTGSAARAGHRTLRAAVPEAAPDYHIIRMPAPVLAVVQDYRIIYTVVAVPVARRTGKPAGHKILVRTQAVDMRAGRRRNFQAGPAMDLRHRLSFPFQDTIL